MDNFGVDGYRLCGDLNSDKQYFRLGPAWWIANKKKTALKLRAERSFG
jgi:hypothetical protein